MFCLYALCALCACSTEGGQKRASDSIGTGIIDGVSYLMGIWDMNPGSAKRGCPPCL